MGYILKLIADSNSIKLKKVVKRIVLKQTGRRGLTGGVNSFNTRQGNVMPESGDYDDTQISVDDSDLPGIEGNTVHEIFQALLTSFGGVITTIFEAINTLTTSLVAAEQDINDLETGKENKSEKGQANGFAPLGADSLVPDEYLPGGGGGGVESVTSSDDYFVVDNDDPANPVGSIDLDELSEGLGLSLGHMNFMGTWSPQTDNINFFDGRPTETLTAYAANVGDVIRVRSIAADHNFGLGSVNVQIGDHIIFDGSNWWKVYTDRVTQTQANSLTGGGDSNLHYHSSDRNRTNHTGTQDISTINGLQTELDQKQDLSEKDQADGYAGLDSSSKINPSQLPAVAITETFVVASEVAMLALTAQVGDVAVRTDLNKSFILVTEPASTLSNWQELLTPTDSVGSVFGRQGVVTAQNGDYTASQITNVPAGNIAGVTVQAALNELDSEKAATTDLTAARRAVLGVQTESGTSHTPDLADAGFITRCDNAAAITVTIPLNSNVPFPIGSVLTFSQKGAGQVTLSPESGSVNLRAPAGLKTRTQYSMIEAYKVDTNEWLVTGDTAA